MIHQSVWVVSSGIICGLVLQETHIVLHLTRLFLIISVSVFVVMCLYYINNINSNTNNYKTRS